ncbi:hypothetical protein HNR44_001039 [Geomicrobium halophilum]|uniref:DUF2777 domain-containing protein n=1 Tax=Geomicrobium halophilum TaxID=549000 RepID=A0A841PJY2_9BACL|nr:DUF2777 family protein [Geomicrobium halophilum]MBB6449090.1 hypothetical protein [Geomicrobium halophilum]
MNRKEAFEYKGHIVLVHNHPECVCYGLLTDIETPKNKIWQGTVTIKGIYSVSNAKTAYNPPYHDGEKVQVAGSKIQPFTGKLARSYRASLLQAIGSLEKDTTRSLLELEEQKQQLQDLRLQLRNKRGKAEDPFLYFSLVNENEEILLQEQSQNEKMLLEGCPFEMEWYDPKTKSWTGVIHDKDWKFTTKSGNNIQLHQKDMIRIHKEQFEPFQILINELEAPAKESLARLMHYYGFQRKHLVKCQNTLLKELLHAEEDQHFSGVNFIIFQKDTSFLVIQHRYERTLHSDQDDYIYDRFECTTEFNERQVITYTNMQTSR